MGWGLCVGDGGGVKGQMWVLFFEVGGGHE